MKNLTRTTLLTALLLGVMCFSGQAADLPHQHGDQAAMPPAAMQEMMMQKMAVMPDQEKTDVRPCMLDGKPCPKPCMDQGKAHRHHARDAGTHGMMGMDHGMMGMDPCRMQQRMDHELFLDRVDALGLSAEQVTKLKAIRAGCRSDNIRTMAEARIKRLELQDLLAADSWTLKEASPLVRAIQTLEGDMLVRHLQAVAEARKVLTAEQLQQAAGAAADDDLEELFN